MPHPLATSRGRSVLAVEALQPWTRPRSLHWLARAAALISLFVAGIWRWATPADPGHATLLATLDVALCLFFAAEFFTRTGWHQSGVHYARWRWFDLFAVIPITAVGPLAVTAVFWLVFACRAIRLVDRSLGDGYMTRWSAGIAGRLEEEVADRIMAQMISRWDRELLDADFGTAMANALRRNQQAVLQRVFAQQLKKGSFAKIAHVTGLKSALEKEEKRAFDALVEMVGSREVDTAIRDVLSATLLTARQGLEARSSRRTRDKAAATGNSPQRTTALPRSGAKANPARATLRSAHLR